MWSAFLRIAVQILAGAGVGMALDKVVPDANLNVTKDIVNSKGEEGKTKIDFLRIGKWILITIIGAYVANVILKLLGVRNLKLF
jgi:hypothetical protein